MSRNNNMDIVEEERKERKNKKRSHLAMEIPEQYQDQISELLVQLLMTDEHVEKKEKIEPEPADLEMEVSRVSAHRITETGVWQFKVHFKGYRDNGEWVNDADCHCEKTIREYLNTLAKPVKTIYCVCRVSSKNQTGPKHVSLDAQEHRLLQTARTRFGAANPATRIKTFKISASAYRGIPNVLQNIGEAAASGDAILTYRVDRLSRNIVKFLSFLEELNERGVQILAQDENIWYHEKKLEFIQGILDANKEAFVIGKRVKLSLERRRARGDEVFGSVPYGFSIKRGQDNRLVRVRNVVEQNVIRRIERELALKRTTKQIAEDLNAAGIRKRNRRWTSAMVTYTFDSSR